jgi:hypothetical protein
MENSMSTQQRTNDHSAVNHHILWMVVIVVLIIFAGLGAFYVTMKSKGEAQMQYQLAATPTSVPPLGSLSLSAQTTQAKVGQSIGMKVVADSEGKDVAGFDILISYDSQFLKVNTVTSLNPNFQISSFTKRKGEISITGTKVSGPQSSAVLSTSNLVAISLSGVKAGQTNVDIKPTITNERTKFIDMNSQQYMPKLSSLQLTIL